MYFPEEKKKIILIDGGLGTTLNDYGLDTLRDPLWSGKVLVQQPEQLAKVHRAFVQAKCDFISTASYQVTTDALMLLHRLTYEQAEEILINSVKIARSVIEEEKTTCHVAASIGPYGATLNDGSEFNGWYTDTMSIEEFKNWHRPRLSILVRAEPDVIAFETIPSQKEAEALVQLLKEFPNVKAWLSFNCQNGEQTAHGEYIEDAAASICRQSPDQLIAVGMNCVHPSVVVPLVKRMSNINCDFIAYPNAGVVWNKDEKRFDAQGQSMISFIRSYIDIGIKYIGGCCHVNPNKIREIRDIIDEYSKS